MATKPPKESRLDRIERDLALFLQGMVELRDSQKKTDELFKRTDERFLELRDSQKKTDELFRRTDEKFLELRDSQKKTDEGILELKESQKKTDEQMRRTDTKLDRVGSQLADLALVQGEVAEDVFKPTKAAPPF